MNMKQVKTLLLLAAVSALMLFHLPAQTAGRQDDGKEYELVILNTNDHHGAVFGTKDKDGVTHGGLSLEASYVKQIRSQHQNVLLLDAGDINTGMPVSNMFDAEPDIKAYNAMKYDAVTIGNHEFDGGLSKFAMQISESDFTWISANVRYGKETLGSPYIIRDYGGLRVAVIGLTTLRTFRIASKHLLTGKNGMSVTFDPEIETVSRMVKYVRAKEKADIVILCGNIGDIREDKQHVTSADIASKVPGIDLIIDGHSHSFFDQAKYTSGVPVVTTSGGTKYVGEGVMKIKDGRVENFTWKPVELNDKDFAPDADMDALLKPYADKAEAAMDEVVITAAAPFEFGAKLTRYQEMASGDYTADAMVYELRKLGVRADFAVVNGGGIRSEIPAGQITRGSVLTMLPFTNTIIALTMNGSDVIDLFKYIGSIKQGAGAFAQVSDGVKYTITYAADGNGTVSGVSLYGKAVAPSEKYIVATNDYLAGGGDGYKVFTRAVSSYNSSMLLSDAFIDYVKTLKSPVKPASAGRITVKGGKLPE